MCSMFLLFAPTDIFVMAEDVEKMSSCHGCGPVRISQLKGESFWRCRWAGQNENA